MNAQSRAVYFYCGFNLVFAEIQVAVGVEGFRNIGTKISIREICFVDRVAIYRDQFDGLVNSQRLYTIKHVVKTI